jgi:hypothetical protein
MPVHIGTLNEKPLHEALKQWYAHPKDKFEVPVDGFVIDIVRGKLLIEIQTRNFTAIRRKLEKLLVNHRVRLVYPIPCEKWLIKQANDNDGAVSRRKSPVRGIYESVFDELVYLPQILGNPGFSIDLLLIQEEEVRRYDGIRGWRRHGWVTDERRLLKVVEHRILSKPSDIYAFIPSSLVEPFTASELAAAIGKPKSLARKMVYCLRLMECIKPVGKRANAILYARLNT